MHREALDSQLPDGFARPRSVREIVVETIGIYRRFPLLFLTFALVVIAPYELIVLAATGHGPLARDGHRSLSEQLLLLLIDTGVVTPLISALHIQAVATIAAGARPRFARVATRGLQVLPVATAAVLVSWVGATLGFLALVVPGVLLTLRWTLVAQVAAIEHEGWLPSLKRSATLTAAHYGHIFALLVVVGLPAAAVSIGVGAIPLGGTAAAASVSVGIGVRTLTASVGALATALLYYDLLGRAAGTPPRPAREHPHLRDLDEPPSSSSG